MMYTEPLNETALIEMITKFPKLLGYPVTTMACSALLLCVQAAMYTAIVTSVPVAIFSGVVVCIPIRNVANRWREMSTFQPTRGASCTRNPVADFSFSLRTKSTVGMGMKKNKKNDASIQPAITVLADSEQHEEEIVFAGHDGVEKKNAKRSTPAIPYHTIPYVTGGR